MSTGQKNQSKKKANSAVYHAYLLRAWQEPFMDPEGEPTWRFTLVHIDGVQTKKGFASLEDLLLHVKQELATKERNEA